MPAKSGGKAKKGAHLGKSIMRKQFRVEPQAAVLETERGKGKLRSVTHCDDLEEFMSNATLEGTDFAAKRGETVLLTSQARTISAADAAPEDASVSTDLPMPRRPQWVEGMSAEELDDAERCSFLSWRRGLASLEEEDGECLTPFEKNLEVWRQLWRVLERSQLLVQIVDARNPLLFRSNDLERYASELKPPRPCILLVNKADLLSEGQRKEWAAYFRTAGVQALFWSAKAASEVMEAVARGEVDPEEEEGEEEEEADEEAKEAEEAEGGAEAASGAAGVAEDVWEEEEEEEAAAEDEDEDEDAMLLRLASASRKAPPRASAVAVLGASASASASVQRARATAPPKASPPPTDGRILGRLELMRVLLARCPPGPVGPGGRPERTVGLVGYPNVGKSSTVNAMVAAKKTNVSSTPGKTKHFQTLHVPDVEGLVLCDCPGLVFPSIAGSKAQMICDGILPIDQMRDYMPPVRLACVRLSPDYFFQAYGVSLRTEEQRRDDPDSPEPAQELLIALSIARGYMNASKGGPDENRAARIVLKDLVDAKLLYVMRPPGAGGGLAGGGGAGGGGGGDWAAAGDGPRAVARARKQPTEATAERYFNKIKTDHEAQDGFGAAFAGRKGAGKQGAHAPPQQFFRPQGFGRVPDRLVASGPKGPVFG